MTDVTYTRFARRLATRRAVTTALFAVLAISPLLLGGFAVVLGLPYGWAALLAFGFLEVLFFLAVPWSMLSGLSRSPKKPWRVHVEHDVLRLQDGTHRTAIPLHEVKRVLIVTPYSPFDTPAVDTMWLEVGGVSIPVPWSDASKEEWTALRELFAKRGVLQVKEA